MKVQLTSGFYDLDTITVDDLKIEDITHSLSNQCRWAGHTPCFYSVAEHSMHVATLALAAHTGLVKGPHAFRSDFTDAKTVVYEALSHEVDEVLGDFISPIKKTLDMQTSRPMRKLAALYGERFNLPQYKEGCIIYSPITLWADEQILRHEAHFFFKDAHKWCERPEKYVENHIKFKLYNSDQALESFSKAWASVGIL